MKKSVILLVIFAMCTTQQQSNLEIDVKITIDSAGKGTDFNEYIKISEGSSALDAFSKVAEITVTSSTYGDYISAVSDLSEQQTESGFVYWAFYLNNEYAPVGAGSYVLENGDNISLVYEESTFS